jgi:hypothetical protein
VVDALTDDEYRELQEFLARHPDTGKVIPGSGGLRKLRWTAKGKGKEEEQGSSIIGSVNATLF